MLVTPYYLETRLSHLDFMPPVMYKPAQNARGRILTLVAEHLLV